MCKPGPPLKLSRNKSETGLKIKKKKENKKLTQKDKSSHKYVQAKQPTQGLNKNKHLNVLNKL